MRHVRFRRIYTVTFGRLAFGSGVETSTVRIFDKESPDFLHFFTSDKYDQAHEVGTTPGFHLGHQSLQRGCCYLNTSRWFWYSRWCMMSGCLSRAAKRLVIQMLFQLKPSRSLKFHFFLKPPNLQYPSHPVTQSSGGGGWASPCRKGFADLRQI